MTKFYVNRPGHSRMIDVPPKDLTTNELCSFLDDIHVDGGNWMPETVTERGYAAINEAIRRLKEYSSIYGELPR